MRDLLRSVLSWLIVLSLSRPAVLAEPPQAPPLTPVQQQRLGEAKRLEKQVQELQKSGKLAEAVAAAEKIVAIQREVYGDRHEAVADALENLAAMREEREDFPAARKTRQEVLALRTQLHGDKHWQVTDAQFALADVDRLARLQPAQRHQFIEARHLDSQVARLYEHGKFAEALPLARRVVELHRQIQGEEHPDSASSLNTLALLYEELGKYAQAEPLYQQALTQRRRLLGEHHPDYANSLNCLAMMYRNRGEYTKAEPLFQQALAIRRETLGEGDMDYATSLNNLALLYDDLGEYARAEPLFQQALKVLRQAVGEGHPKYAAGLNNLALLYGSMGNYARAEPLFHQALKVDRQVGGEDNPHYAITLNNLAMLYITMGDYTKAEPLFQQALTIKRRVIGENHPSYALSLSDLGLFYEMMGDHARAEPLFKQALAVRRQVLGESHPHYAVSLNNLAMLYWARREYARAKPLFQQALKALRQAVGEGHPDYATGLNNLARLHQDLGDNAQAEPLFKQALAIRRQALGESHTDYAISLHDLARLYQAQGEYARAEPLYRQALAIDEQFWRDGFAVLSERQRVRLLGSLRSAVDAYLSIGPEGQIPAESLYEHVLAWKGAVAARQTEDRLARDQPELKSLVQRLTRARTRLAHLAFATPLPRQREAWLRQIDDLRNEKENLEGELGRRSQRFQTEQRRQRLKRKDVAQALPAATIFVDVFEYLHSSPPSGGKGPFRKERRLLAFVLGRDQKLAYVPLQAAAPIDKAVRAWRQAMTTGDAKALARAAATLAERVWKPLQPHLASAQTVLIAPDGALTQFPMAVLPGRRPGSYLLEDLAIGYVTSGRQVVDIFTPPTKTDAHGLLALGGIDYAADPGAAATPALVASVRAPRVAANERSGFGYLPGTEREARHCRELFRQTFPQERALLLTGAAADEGRFKQECTKHWRYLHLATHGFFESPTRVAALLRGASGGALPPEAKAEEGKAFALAPLLRSGVVLAGAAHQRTAPASSPPGEEPTGEDGILTAEEVAALDLRGCELVVLSACDTGLGHVEQGEGVLGLQRAFQAAGARTLLASFWRVDDAATTLLMEEFYANLWQKKLSKLEALRQAQLTVLRQPARVQEGARTLRTELAKRGLGLKAQPLPEGGKVGDRSPPAWWAGFVLSGETR